MSLKEILLGYLLYLVPKNLMSYWVGRLTCLKMPGILGPALVAWFARRYKLNMDEAEFPLEAYPSINQLFTRRLKPGARPWERVSSILLIPVSPSVGKLF